MINIVDEKEQETLLHMVAIHLCEKIRALLANRTQVNIAVPGGRNVAKIFQVMKGEQLDWRQVHFFIIDERLVPIDHPDSNYKLLKDNFIDSLVKEGRIDSGNAHPFIFDPASGGRGADNYERVLKEHGFRYDIILLSSGEDGHVGALYPRHHSILDRRHGYIVMDDSPKPPPERMTSSLSLMQTADVAVLLFVGEAKAEAYGKFKDPRYSITDCPAKLVVTMKDATVFTDLM